MIEPRLHLTSALETFHRLGARPWADRAARELPRPGRTDPAALTEIATRSRPRSCRSPGWPPADSATRDRSTAVAVAPHGRSGRTCTGSSPSSTSHPALRWITVPAGVGDVRVRIIKPRGATGTEAYSNGSSGLFSSTVRAYSAPEHYRWVVAGRRSSPYICPATGVGSCDGGLVKPRAKAAQATVHELGPDGTGRSQRAS
jgi:hypothetical protein